MNEKAPPGSPAASSRAVWPTMQRINRPRIGSQHIAVQRVHMGSDELRTQRAVLSMRKHGAAGRKVKHGAAAIMGIALAVLVWVASALYEGGAP